MIEHYAILNDIHFPFEDRTRYAVALNIIKTIKPAHIYLNGDIGEFLGVSSHALHPTDKADFCKELIYINKRFDELCELFPDVPVTFICGNHEYRFFRYVRDVAPQMWGLMDCPSLLKFPDRPRWKFIDYGPSQYVQCGNSKLWLRHEPLGGGMNAAKFTAENAYVDTAFGHTHTYQVYAHKKMGPKPYTTKAYSLGWLGDRNRPVFDYRGNRDRWVPGMTLVECDAETGEYVLEFIDMTRLPVLYRGDKYDARHKG